MRRVLFVVGACVLTLACAPAFAHKGNPNFLSEITRVEPSSLRAEIVNRDDGLMLTSPGGQEVVILGYDEEPYARIAADGSVEVNTRSKAYYLNEDRFGTAKAPADAGPEAEPVWKPVSKTGRFEWHDHRAHWMNKSRPPQVSDPGVRTKVFDWEIPLRVDGRPGIVAGTLHWTPLPGGGAPTGAIVAGVVIVLGLLAAVVVVRRRRTRGATAEREAW